MPQRWTISLFLYLPVKVGRRCFWWFLPLCLVLPAWTLALPAWAETAEEEAEEEAEGCAAEAFADPPLGAPYADHQGKQIASIRFRTVGVFDTENPREDNYLYRLLNRLHINTRPYVLESQLLVSVGDEVDSRRIAESERILRTRPYLGDARIRVDEDCGDSVALVVETRDVWTTDPTVALSRKGGETRSGFGFSEGNIAGTGTRFAIDYRDDPQRTSIGYSFHSPHLFNRPLELRLRFSDNSDGRDTLVQVQRPFYSLHTTWAAGVYNEDTTQIEEIRYGGDLVNSYRHSLEYREAFVGWAPLTSDQYIHRVSMGVTQEQHRFNEMEETQGPLPEASNIIYNWVQYHYFENKFAVYRNLHQLQRTEDVAVGADLQLRLGYGGSSFGNDYDTIRSQIDYSDLIGLGEHQLLRFSLSLDAHHYKNSERGNERVVGGELSYFVLDGTKHRWFASLRYDHGHHLPQHRELTAGGELGLRGYPLDYQRGRQRYLATVEKRYVSDLHLFNLIRLGALAFIDFGRAWNHDYDRSGHLSNVGVGLRMSSSKARVGHVLHLDLAYPLAEKDAVGDYQLHVQASHIF